MNRIAVVMIAVLATLAGPLAAGADDGYPEDLLERYAECMERNDLQQIKDLLWTHHNVEPIDATIYGLPKDDLDDRSLLTIDERLKVREEKESVGIFLPTSGPLQYPHHLRPSIDAWYELTGERPDCSEILADSGYQPPAPEDLGSGWAADRNLTAYDSADRGEVDIVVDYANPNRIMATSVPAGGSEISDHVAASSDWGQTWSNGQNGTNAGSDWECDPVSYYQRSTGNVYHSKIACAGGCWTWTRVMMRKSSNNGTSWSDCGGRPGSGDSEDRQWHTADNTALWDADGDGTPETPNSCYGNIYVTWHDYNQEKVARSTDNCTTWTSNTNLTNPSNAITPDINVAADGHAYVAWQNYGDGTFKMAGSSDCGATWAAPAPKTVRTRFGDWKNFIPAQCQRGISTMPNVDVDRAPRSAYYGRVYMSFFDFNQSGCGSGPGCSNWSSTCNYDIWFSYSDNQGATWSTPVNLTASDGNLVDHFMGYMRVDETDGSIYIAHHRTRLNPTSLTDRQKTHYFVMRSIDGGTTWQSFQASSLEGDERLSGASSFERGDYNRLDVYAGVAWPLWIDRRNTAGEEEIVVRKLCSEPSHWSERAPSFTTPAVAAEPIGMRLIEVSWDAPDLYWGDADEDPAARKYQLWVDGALAEDDIPWTATATTWEAADCITDHEFIVRAINQCGIHKDYTPVVTQATGCCAANPSVDVTPDGPLTSCLGTPVALTANLSGGTGPFDYQWTRDGVPIAAATGASYAANDTDTHSYNCQVMGAGCTEFERDRFPAQLSWQAAPSFAGVESVTNMYDSTCTLELGWSAASSVCPGPISYNVYRSATPGFTPGTANRVAGGVSGTAYTDVDALDSGEPHYYVVRAVEGSNGVEESNQVEAWGLPTGPIITGSWLDDAGDSGIAKLSGEAPWTVDPSGGHFAPAVYATGPYDTDTCAVITSPEMHIGSNPQLSFYSDFDIEDGWDKGEVQISTDGGTSWLRVEVDYPGFGAAVGHDACLLAQGDYFTGTSAGYGQYSASLAAWSGQDVMLRWQLSTDDRVNGAGWWLDDLEVTNVEVPDSCTPGSIVSHIFSDGFENGDLNGWSSAQP